MKTKAQLKREIKEAKNLVFIAEYQHGFSSEQRKTEIRKLVALQIELNNK